MEFDLLQAFVNVGFPTTVASWFMFRMEKILNNNTDALHKLIALVASLKRKL